MREVIVEEFQSGLEAQEALEVLLSEGCNGRIQERAASGVDQYLHPAGRWYELWVRETDLEKAKPIVAAFRADLEREAPLAEAAAREEASPEAPAATPEDTPRPTTLSDQQRKAGGYLQLQAALA